MLILTAMLAAATMPPTTMMNAARKTLRKVQMPGGRDYSHKDDENSTPAERFRGERSLLAGPDQHTGDPGTPLPCTDQHDG
jgi:hypothetical protein